jgi:primase-polymerase (primpol)-like protein
MTRLPSENVAPPPILTPILKNIPKELKDRPQWVLWKGEWLPDKGKYSKVPYSAKTGEKASSTNPSTWSSFTHTVKTYQGTSVYLGGGFVLTESDPFVGIDLDHCVRPDGIIEDWAMAAVESFNSYTEISPSGTGLRIFIKGTLPPGGRKKGNVEVYATGRFLTVTGHRLTDTTHVFDRQDALEAFHKEHFPQEPPRNPEVLAGLPSLPTVDDQALLDKAFTAKNGGDIRALFNGDTGGHNGDHSAADLALCSLLAFYTGSDKSRLDRIFRSSGLYRAKWDVKHFSNGQTYGDHTLEKAIAGCSDFYDWDKKASAKIKSIKPKTNDAPIGDESEEQEEKKAKKSQADLLVELALSDGNDYYHDPDRVAYVDNYCPHRETYRVRSKAFTDLLKWRYYQACGKAPGAQAIQDALGVLEGKATFEGPERHVYVRVAPGPNGEIYFDLGNDAWQAVEITAAGWRVVTAPSVRFRRPKGQQPLPMPQRGGSLARFLEVFSIPADAWTLILGWLVMLLNPHGPYPLLILGGEQGVGKSTLSRFLRSIVDPSGTGLRSEPKEVRDLLIGATNSWILAFDNLSGVGGWLSDGLCRLSTGGGFATRTLYENDEETLLDAKRPVILNGIGELANRSDLLDRALTVNLEPIPASERRSEKELNALFNELHPYLLGALLDAVSMALRNQDSVQLAELPRMADFALFVSAAEPALPIASGEFMRCYTGNRHDAHSAALDNPVASAVRALVDRFDPWAGTATQLLKALEGLTDEAQRRARSYPKDGANLGKILARLAPNLRAVGIEVRHERTYQGRKWVLEKRGGNAVMPSLPSCDDPKPKPSATLEHDGKHDSKNDHDSKCRHEQNSRHVPVMPEIPPPSGLQPKHDGNDSNDGKKPTSSKWKGRL